MTEFSKLANMTDSEVTRELMALCTEARSVERRMLLVCIKGDDYGVSDAPAALTKLMDLVGDMPIQERRILLFFARRLIVIGQRGYGAYDLSMPRKSGKPIGLDACEEFADAVVYRTEDSMRGANVTDIPVVMQLMRTSLTDLLRREAI